MSRWGMQQTKKPYQCYMCKVTFQPPAERHFDNDNKPNGFPLSYCPPCAAITSENHQSPSAASLSPENLKEVESIVYPAVNRIESLVGALDARLNTFIRNHEVLHEKQTAIRADVEAKLAALAQRVKDLENLKV